MGVLLPVGNDEDQIWSGVGWNRSGQQHHYGCDGNDGIDSTHELGRS